MNRKEKIEKELEKLYFIGLKNLSKKDILKIVKILNKMNRTLARQLVLEWIFAKMLYYMKFVSYMFIVLGVIMLMFYFIGFSRGNYVPKIKTKKQVVYPKLEELYGDNDVKRVKYCIQVLKEERNKTLKGVYPHSYLDYCIVFNGIVRAESGGQKTWLSYGYRNPISLKCNPTWIKMGIATRGKYGFCKFRQYRYAIVAWTRLWYKMGYNSNTIRTAKKYTGMDNWRGWYNHLQYWKKKVRKYFK